MPAEPPKIAKARLRSLGPDGTELEVHFNPVSLVYSVENSAPQQSGDPKRRQFAAQFSAKLSMDLQFDNTDNGDDVRRDTLKVARFMQASADAQAAVAAAGNGDTPPKAQPVLSFEWGAYHFQGTMESFKETIDFFSAEGVPLRALVSIGLARQDKVFDEELADARKAVKDANAATLVPTSGSDSAQRVVDRGGAPGAARQVAADNRLESLRFTGGRTLQVNTGVEFKRAAGFARSAPPGGGALSGAGGALFGGQASAGVTASAGAFAGLESARAGGGGASRLNPLAMLPGTAAADISAHAAASFELGGAANNAGGAGLSADVGAQFSFRDRLIFDSDD